MTKKTDTTTTNVETPASNIDEKFLEQAEKQYLNELKKSRLTKKNIDSSVFQGIVEEMARELQDHEAIDDLVNGSQLGATKRNILGTIIFGFNDGWMRYTSSNTKYVLEVAKSLHAPQFAEFLSEPKTLENVEKFISWYETQKG